MFALSGAPLRSRRKPGRIACALLTSKQNEGGEDAGGMPFTNATGSFRFENGQVKVMKVEGVKPYQTFSDDASGLSVRAVFLDHLNQWTIAD